MVMGSLFDTPTDEEDQNPPQPQQPPPQDPLAQQPVNVEPQPAQLPAFSDQDSINRAQAAVGNALQGVNTVAQLGAPPPVQGPPVPQPTGPLVNSTGLPALNTPNPDLPINQAIINQGQQAQQALAQNGPTINYQNGQPYYGPSFGDAFLQGAVGAGIGAPIFGPAGAAIRTAGSMLGGSAAPAAVSALGGNPTEQRIAGTIGSLAPFTGANPWALAGGVGGSEFGQRTGLDVPLPFVGSLDTLLGAGLPSAFERGARAANADPLAGIQSPQGVPGATGLGNDLNTPKSDWLQQLNTAPRDRFTGLSPDKSQVPAYQENIASVTGAQTGRPMDFNGLRQEGTEPRRAGTGTFYGIDPNTTNLYALDRGTGEGYDSKVGGATGGAENSLTVERVHLDNPLVIEGGHHQLAQVGPQVFAESPAKDALLDFWQQGIPTNPREAWYVKSDQLIADAAKTSGYDGIVYRRPTEDLWDMPNWGKNVASPKSLSELGNSAVNDTEIVKFDQPPTTTTTAPTSTTTTSGAYPPADQFASPEHQQGYYQGLLDTTQLAPHEFRPTRGPDDTDFNQGYKEARANLPPGSLVNAPYPENYISPAAQASNTFDQMAARNQSITRPTGNEPGMAEFNAQRATGAQAGEASAPINNNGGNGGNRPPTGGTGRTPYDSSRNSTVGLLQQLQDISGLPMALKVDAHLPLLRQGAASIFSDPEAAFKGMDAGIKSFVSQNGAEAAMQAVHDLPLYSTAKASGLFESQHGPNVAPSQRESFQEYRGSGKTLASQLTGLVPLAENTGRGYSAEMNTTRFLRFEHVAQNMLDAGLTPGENPRAFRALADVINNQTGHGPIGQGSVPFFFSLPALSGRVAMWTDLITKMGNPLQAGAYQEVVKGALSQAALGASMLGLAAAGGATIKQESSGGLPIAQWAGKLGTQIFDPWAGQNAIVKLVLNSVKIINNDQLSDGDIRDQLKDTYLKFARGELGPLQGKIVDVVTGKDYNGNAIPGNGVLGRINTLAKDPDQWINFVAPFWADSIYNGAKAFGLGGGLRGLPSFLGGSVTTYQNSAAGQAHFDATNPEHLQQAFPNAPVMQGILQGKQWNELLSTEKSAITKTLDPKVVSEIKAEQRQQNPAFAQHSDAVDYLTQKKNAAENELLDRYNAGTLDGPHTANLLKAVQADYYTTKDKVDNDPAFKAEVAKLPANTNSAQAALDGYYKIPDKAGRDQYIQWLASQSPQLAARIATAVQPQNQTKLELMYANGELR